MLCSLVFAGCGAAPKPQASAPEPYDWSDYKGTFAHADERPATEAAKPKPADPKPVADAKAVADPKAAADPKAQPAGAAAPEAPEGAPAKKVSRGTIQGESV